MTSHGNVVAIITRAETTEGHRVKYRISLPLSSTEEKWNFERNDYISCRVVPATWNLQLTFHKMDENESILCSIVFRRTDDLNIPVNAKIWIEFSGSTCTEDDKKLLQREGLRPGEEIRATIDQVVPFGDTSRLPHQSLCAQVTVTIEDCHSEREHDLTPRPTERCGFRALAIILILSLICMPLMIGTKYFQIV